MKVVVQNELAIWIKVVVHIEVVLGAGKYLLIGQCPEAPSPSHPELMDAMGSPLQ